MNRATKIIRFFLLLSGVLIFFSCSDLNHPQEDDSEDGSSVDWGDTAKPFVITVDTRISGASYSTQFTIPAEGSGFDYSVDWGDGSINTHLTGSKTHTYDYPNTYNIEIHGTFPCLQFPENVENGDAPKLIDLVQWGEQEWDSFHGAFRGCSNIVDFSAEDIPDLSNVTDMSYMFTGATAFNGALGSWDIHCVTDMTGMLSGSALSLETYSNTLIGWESQASIPSNLSLGAADLIYLSNASASRSSLVDIHGWTITGDRSLASILKALVGESLTDAAGVFVPTESLEGKKIALYFAAQWHPSCRRYTPDIVNAYNEMIAAGKPFEIVFVSMDYSEDDMNTFMNDYSMPWLAIPYTSTDLRLSLKSKYSTTIPLLVVFDPQCNLITSSGFTDVMNYEANAYELW